ncbi:helix-turn-helix domain-containing protein [Alloalcanivorax sp. C16-1]|uniref:helix-turn-helix domain-containing protein n=1 Tax=Alloalcanivorax sp. C16-1 TaxID=3390051 RepID=UPI0039705826
MNKPGDRGQPVSDWNADIWNWSPDQGAWTPRDGLPSRCVYLALATPAAPHPDNYDYWRHTVFYDFAADAPAPEQRRTFAARAAGLVGPQCSLFWYQSQRLSGHRHGLHCRRDDQDDLTLGLVLRGRRRHRLDDGTLLIAGPGELFLYDPRQPCRINWSDHAGIHLTLPRPALSPLFATDRLDLPALLARLRQTPISGFLASHLARLAVEGERLPRAHRALLLEQTRSLAVATLGTAFGIPAEDSEPEAAYLRARQLILQRLDEPDLGPDTLARALGCSRATLYRLFARHQDTVAGCLREARLHRAHQLLTSAPAHLGVAELAARCGFLDSSSFSRLFRRRYGLRPSDLRPGGRSQ